MSHFAKLPRWLEDYSIRDDSVLFKIVTYLSLKAQFTPGKEVLFHGKPYKLGVGQLTTGRTKISEATGVQEHAIKWTMNKLKSSQRVSIETDNQCSLITCNWFLENPADCPTSDQRMDSDLSDECPATSLKVSTNTDIEQDREKIYKRKEIPIAPNDVPSSPPEEASDLVKYLCSKWKDFTPPKAIKFERSSIEDEDNVN